MTSIPAGPSSAAVEAFRERIVRVLHRELHWTPRLEDPEVPGHARTAPPPPRSPGSRQQLVPLDPDRRPRLDHLDGRVPGVPVADEDERGSVLIRRAPAATGMDVGEDEGRAVARVHPVEVHAEDLIPPGGGAIGKQPAPARGSRARSGRPRRSRRNRPAPGVPGSREAGRHLEVERGHVPFVPDLVRGEQALQRTADVAPRPRVVDRSGRGRRSCRRSARSAALPRCRSAPRPVGGASDRSRRGPARRSPRIGHPGAPRSGPHPRFGPRMIRSVASITDVRAEPIAERAHTLDPSTARSELRREIAAHEARGPGRSTGSALSGPRSARRRGRGAGA